MLQKEYSHNWYLLNKEEIGTKHAKWRGEHKSYFKDYYNLHKKEVRERQNKHLKEQLKDEGFRLKYNEKKRKWFWGNYDEISKSKRKGRRKLRNKMLLLMGYYLLMSHERLGVS